ncbi:PQQ-binding-like beta-propeller repeat protein [bacterium]|nr:PQQ-binding-like beta-propeller repeat protein [bacterium]
MRHAHALACITLAAALLCSNAPAGGLIVHLGCGDGRETAALRAGERTVVHGLDTDPAKIKLAREHLLALGVYGPVSVDVFDGKHLPYADNLVNVIVVGDSAHGVPRKELLRALAPGGVARVGTEKVVKPWPADIDHWTHYLYDASGNPVSTDRRVAPPRHLQWDGAPRWSRSHEADMSVTAAVSAGGRLFHTLDEGPIGIHETPQKTRLFPDKSSLVARDAFNGIVLWKRPLPGWGSAAWDKDRAKWGKADHMWSSPYTLPRRLVAADDRLYVTLGFRTFVSELDAATGKTLREFAETADTEEILLHEGLLILRVLGKDKGEAIAALDLSSGKTLWRTPAAKVTGLTLAALGSRVCFHDSKGLHGLDEKTGREAWLAKPKPQGKTPDATVVMHEKAVLLAGWGQTHAFDPADGKLLWRRKTGNSFRGTSDVFVAGGRAWTGTLTTQGVDVRTGKPVGKLDPGHLFTGGHHVRCYRAKATARFLLSSKRGVEFLDLTSNQHMKNDWVRGACRYGILPANGLLYAPSHPCFCFPGVKLTGFNALSAQDGAMSPERRKKPQTVRGPAYGDIPHSALPVPQSTDWPTYRHDIARSGRAGGAVSANLKERWQVSLPGKLTPPVMAAGRLFVASVDTHTVHCLDADTGKARWHHVAGGAVDSPPTLHGGRVLFGCTDGTVTCLRASDGEVVWSFRAAPYAKRIVSYGRVESAWPVHGSVLVARNTVYFAAGRSSYLDGGIYMYGLDVATGAIRCQARLDGPHPDLAKPSNRAHEMDGSRNDILVSDRGKLFLTQNAFDLTLKPLEAPTIAKYGARKMDRHLVATGGFLDDSGFDRIYWMYAERWPGLYVAVDASKAGQILVFDDDTVYGLHLFTRKFSRSPYFQPGSGCELFADAVGNEPVLNKAQASRERGTMSRAAPPKWSVQIPVRARAMALAGNHLFLAGPPDVIDAKDPLGSFEGRKGAQLWAVSTADGKKLAAYDLTAPPVFDGLIAADGSLFMTMRDGTVRCWDAKGNE